MLNENADCFYIHHENGVLLKFCYDIEQGIYYQIQKTHKWSEKICVYKECFSYFHVIADGLSRIHVVCQDISGDIMLCMLEDEKWRYEILVHLDIIMPRYLRAFFFDEDLHLLYHRVDTMMNLDVLMFQKVKQGIKFSSPRMISILEYYKKFPFSIYCMSNGNIELLYMSNIITKEYQLNVTTYHSDHDTWGKNEVLHTSTMPFIDYSFCAQKNWKHCLFITQDNQIRKINYRNNQKEGSQVTILFQHKSISSCLLVKLKKEIVALWTCENILYGSFSCNHGLEFSKPIVYVQLKGTAPVKVFYQELASMEKEKTMENKQTIEYKKTRRSYELYRIYYQGEEQLLFPELLLNYRTEWSIKSIDDISVMTH